MNEKYLWDKSGSDAEIEELEDMLSVFRHQAEAPVVNAASNVVTFPQRTFRRQQIFAIAASLAVAAFAGVWFMQARSGDEVVSVKPAAQPEVTQAQTKGLIVPQTVPATDNIAPEATVKTASATATLKPKAVKAFYTRPKRELSVRHTTTVAKLTKEEQFAYDQLLLALSITSSKLQVVRDAVSRSEVNTDKAVK